MGREGLKGRAIWQDKSGPLATIAEGEFYRAFQLAFEDTAYRIQSKPKEFDKIYTTVPLSAEVQSQIHIPVKGIVRHGISPDYAIENIKTKKTLYVEVKRQNGWVEDGKHSDGRGNAHERSCKYFPPDFYT